MARLGVNMWIHFGDVDFPFINHARACDRIAEFTGTYTDDPMSHLSNDGYPVTFPSGASGCDWGILEGYFVDHSGSERWVLEWTGAGECFINLTYPSDISGETPNSSSAGRKEYSITSASKGDPLMTFLFNIFCDTSGAVSDIKFFRKSLEINLDNGELTNPHLRTMYQEWERIRFMDWQGTNSSPNVIWGLRCKASNASWRGHCISDKNYYAGTVTLSGGDSDLTSAATITGNPSSWTEDMTAVFRIKAADITTVDAPIKTITAFTSASPGVATSNGHGFANGTLLTFHQGTGSGGDWNRRLQGYTGVIADIGQEEHVPTIWYEVANTTANTFTLKRDGVDVNTSTWGTYTASSAQCRKQIRFKTSTLPFKPVFGSDFNHITGIGAGTEFLQVNYDSQMDALILQPIAVTGDGFHLGMPIEHLVQATNEINGPHPWFCVPYRATADYQTNMLTYIRDNLSAGLFPIYLEYSNEIWNTGNGFNQTNYSNFKGILEYEIGGSLDGNGFAEAMNYYYAKRCTEMISIAETVFGGDFATKVRVVVGGRTIEARDGWLDARLEGHASLSFTPASKAYGFAIAAYYENFRDSGNGIAEAEYVWKYKQGGADRTAALAWFDDKMRDVESNATTLDYCRDTLWPAFVTKCGEHNIEFTMYEGGFGVLAKFNVYDTQTHLGDHLSDSVQAISAIVTNGSGGLRCTIEDTSQYVNGQEYIIAGSTDTPEANGKHAITIINGTTFDIAGVPLVNTYVDARGYISDDRMEFVEGYLRSALWTATYEEALDDFIAAGGRVPMQYPLIAPHSDQSAFSVIEPNIFQYEGETIPAYAMLQEWNASSPAFEQAARGLGRLQLR